MVALQFRVVEVRGRKGCMFGVAKKSDEKQILDRGRMSASRGRCAVLLGNANDAVSYVELA